MNKKERAAYKRAWYRKNRERVLAYQRKYAADNQERERERTKLWMEENADRVREYKRKYRDANRSTINAKRTLYAAQRRKTDPAYLDLEHEIAKRYYDKDPGARMLKDFDRKIQCLEYLGGKCSLCGFADHPAGLEFHHVKREDKEFSIATEIRKGMDVLMPELDKCVILCSRCHRIAEWERKHKPFKLKKEQSND